MVRAFDVSGIQTTLFQRIGFLLCQNAYIGVAAFSGAAGVKRGATDRANFRLRCSSPEKVAEEGPFRPVKVPRTLDFDAPLDLASPKSPH